MRPLEHVIMTTRGGFAVKRSHRQSRHIVTEVHDLFDTGIKVKALDDTTPISA
jgi:hypothetical protein